MVISGGFVEITVLFILYIDQMLDSHLRTLDGITTTNNQYQRYKIGFIERE